MTGPANRLSRLFREAAADGFGNVMADGLGARLRQGCDKVLATDDAPPELSGLRVTLEDFEGLGRHDRSVVVARGLRLCALVQPAGGPAPKPGPEPADPRDRSVSTLPGVGPATARKLEAKGLQTLEDLAYLLPLGYRDHRNPRPLCELAEGDIAVVGGEVRSFRQGFFRGRSMATMVVAPQAHHGVDRLTLRWFHRVGGLSAKGTTGAEVTIVGTVRDYKGAPSMVHPMVLGPDEQPPAIAVRYPVVEGVGAATLAKLCRAAAATLAKAQAVVDAVPPGALQGSGLPSAAQALATVHRPDPELPPEAVAALDEGRSDAHRRLAFDELFFVQLEVLLQRAHFRGAAATIRADEVDDEAVRACLPFEPTQAQWRAVRQLERDLVAPQPMLRLLQGDVGSGKTAVAFAAAHAIIAAGGQVAIMAPTEILAEQHRRTLAQWCEAAGIRLGFLTGATPRAQRASLLALVGAGQIDLLVGTHALIVSDVTFASLGLVVVDEQHRFGVEQRAALWRKGGRPHVLVMTATPIPRTLALTAYGELDVSIIDEMPPGRQPAQTTLVTGARGLQRARQAVARAVKAGTQAFVVCPLVEPSEVLEVTSTDRTAAAMAELIPDARIGIVHGRMPAKDKDAVMDRFRAGELQVLVATSVIEVGVDIPQARMMLIEHAQRFGLAQLHQLRGRIGRGGGISKCVLHTAGGPKTEGAQRVSVLVETSDGFVVAERDLATRGPGELFGIRQAGAPRLRALSSGAVGTRLLVLAREAAQTVLADDPELESHALTGAELERRRARRPAVSPGAG